MVTRKRKPVHSQQRYNLFFQRLLFQGWDSILDMLDNYYTTELHQQSCKNSGLQMVTSEDSELANTENSLHLWLYEHIQLIHIHAFMHVLLLSIPPQIHVLGALCRMDCTQPLKIHPTLEIHRSNRNKSLFTLNNYKLGSFISKQMCEGFPLSREAWSLRSVQFRLHHRGAKPPYSTA